MAGRPPIPLQYSSVDQEQKRVSDRERRRREALKCYNESTYGQRHPIAGGFVWAGIWVLAITLLSLLARRWAGTPVGQALGFILTVVFMTYYLLVYISRKGW